MEKTPGILGFLARYVVFMGAALVLIGYEPLKAVIDVNGYYTAGVVRATAFLLEFMGIPAPFAGDVIHLPGLALQVRFGCNGLEALLIYSVAVLAFPASWRFRAVGIGAGALVLQPLNILRIAALGFIGVKLPSWFEVVHIYVAQGMMIAVALVLFLVWIAHVERST